MPSLPRSLIITSLALFLSSCITSTAFVNYDDLGVYSSGTSGNQKFKDVGPIIAGKSSWLFANCNALATTAIKNLLDAAKAGGANTVYDIKFFGKAEKTQVPTCIRRMGAALFIIPAFFPILATSKATGIAAKIIPETSRTGRIDLHKGADTTALAIEYVRTHMQQ
jgi:hypothetical protein